MLETSDEIEALFDELFPLPRSITGEGYRRSLQNLSRYVPFEALKTASGTEVFDWTVPDEWVIDDAYLIDPMGNKILDFAPAYGDDPAGRCSSALRSGAHRQSV